jgi:hypothetical protein
MGTIWMPAWGLPWVCMACGVRPKNVADATKHRGDTGHWHRLNDRTEPKGVENDGLDTQQDASTDRGALD